MLPHREAPKKRAHLHHSQGALTPRRIIFASLATVCLFCVYVNYRFFFSSTASVVSPHHQEEEKRSYTAAEAFKAASQLKKRQQEAIALADQLAFETREVQHILFTSGCTEKDLVHTEVLASTARKTGFEREISHLLYGCTLAASDAFIKKKNPQHRVHTVSFPAITPDTLAYVYGEDQLTTTVHPRVIQEWLEIEGEWQQALKEDDFIMVVDSDAIFTKKIDIWNLFREVTDVKHPRIFGQDAAWYWPSRFPLNVNELRRVVPETDSQVHNMQDWREYAATTPFVVEVGVLKSLLPSIVEYWGNLPVAQKYLAYPLAAAHHHISIGISGVLSVHHYPSRYENWDFADDIKHNPCNESAGKDIELLSYPVTMRAQNFTLPQWIDGRDWSFFDDQLPPDLLHCDAWLIKQPTGRLWYLASHTSGYERVPNILRRRHAISVCLATQAYNSAITEYRHQSCPMGYNTNKKIPMEYKGKTWATALAMSSKTEMKEEPIVYFGEYEKKQPADAPKLKPGQVESDDVHFVFSTTCEPYQNWQSQVLAHSFARVKQRGSLTRIVSGCTSEELQEVVRRTRTTPHLQLHVTVDYGNKPVPGLETDDYAPYNKPFGLRHWLRNANPPVTESMLVIVDPDFIFVKPFLVNSDLRVAKTEDVVSGNYQEHAEVIEGFRQYKRFHVYEGKRDIQQVNDHVTDGVAVAQRWSSYLGAAGFDGPGTTNLVVCPECKHVSKADALEFYAVGPPYAIMRKDLTRMADDYCDFTVKKRELHRDVWMAEMLGYSLAAMKYNVTHTTFDNLALSGKDDEYWGFLNLIKGNPCEDPVVPMIPGEMAPMFHGCHSYRAYDANGHYWIYYKQLMPNDVFACDSWLLAVPPPSVWTVAKKSKDLKQLKHAYGVCTAIKLVNQELLQYKQQVCVNGYNENRKLVLLDPRPAAKLQVGRVHPKWEEAGQEIALKQKT